MKPRTIALLLLAAIAQSGAAQDGPHRATAVFAGGCFWSTERDLEAVPGVMSAVSGLTGGRTANPTYDQVVRGGTGHREAVIVIYDPARIGYGQLVRRFLRTIDPTDAGGQFCDRGDNYRTAIFVRTAGERRQAEAALAEAGRALHAPIATTIVPRGRFYPAEAYHQDYARRNPAQYNRYRRGCGKDARLRQLWGNAAA